MSTVKNDRWERFKKHSLHRPELGLTLDVSRMDFTEDFLTRMEPAMQRALSAMDELEKGAIANPDENRMVGHYWLRKPELAPDPQIAAAIRETNADVRSFAKAVLSGEIKGAGGTFTDALIIGIGGSALGPQFVGKALNEGKGLRLHFFDNTDPDGMDVVLRELEGRLDRNLAVVISKSGGTKETRNGMLEAKSAYEKAGISFDKHSVAITGEGSELDKTAQEGGWLKRFPMWDWVGGRTSELSAVGLLPAELQGIDTEQLLAGAAASDQATRQKNTGSNPACQLALMWWLAGNGKGEKDMVVLPYKDRLELFSKYLQQLIMESLGKEFDLKRNTVNQGIAVYGNKGSTDQHAYVQQLREGVHNFFVTFINVLEDRSGENLEVEPGVSTGDFLNGFYLGTREALTEKGRGSVSITIDRVNPFSVGVLIALFERAVGLYACLVGINAYHQPGVEAGKKAAAAVIRLQKAVLAGLRKQKGTALSAEALAKELGEENPEMVFRVCEHLAANKRFGIGVRRGDRIWESTYAAQ
ncbi:MAG TPA: glucose-6-phosphate isomerase [Verrucomicrobiales bacterium]|nr:glucose-6-phosphate isomerase [Verrucomicrobiales bacterium]